MTDMIENHYISATDGIKNQGWRHSKQPPVYPFEEDIILNINGINKPLKHSKRMWEMMMSTLFPTVSQSDFDDEMTLGKPGEYYKRIATVAIKDFYYSYYLGQDDVYSSFPIPTDTWDSIDPKIQDLALTAYLRTRGDSVTVSRVTDGHMIYDLTERGKSLFFWISRLLINLLEELQAMTINSAKYATRLSQMQQQLSIKMQDSKFNPEIPSWHSDQFTTDRNALKGHLVEIMRTRRADLQKQTGQAGGVLETNNANVEAQSAALVAYMNLANRIAKKFFK